jgi:predicted TIM-barrel fold metal-dependent hydrolase
VNSPPYRGKISAETMNGELKRFYYDTAAIPGVSTMVALADFVSASQIVYGTDFPYGAGALHTAGVLKVFKGDDLVKVDRGNAERLVPRLKT